MPQTVFITGTDSGLGQALVDRFLTSGWQVIAGQFRRQAAITGQQELHTVALDVRIMESVRAAAQAAGTIAGSIDLLINNAGINADKDIPLEQLDIDISRDVIDVNALGPLRMVQQFLPLLEKGAMKRIVNISSEAGSLQGCYRTSWYGYCMSKAALNMQSRILSNYLRPRGFTVLIVHPGWMRSGMGSADATFAPEETAAHLYPIITGPRTKESPMYFQWDGKPLPW
jgi:NAD(P)-dependent dehydrogenase (short-subunit alcohol dehydrogenase family)